MSDKLVPTIEEFKGNKILVLNPREKFTFSFGLQKAKLILQNLEAIQKFVEQYDKKKGDTE